MSQIPSPEECIDLLKSKGCSVKVINHCKAVTYVAVKIAEKANADVVLVEASSLLHDIGRCKTHGITHAVEGVRIAKELDLPKSIVKIIEINSNGDANHIGKNFIKLKINIQNVTKMKSRPIKNII